MGQVQNHPKSIRKFEENKELQAIDEQRGLYLNIRNNKVYIKSHLVVGTIEDIEYEKQIYLFRRMNDNFVVSVDYCDINKQQSCSSFSAINYFIEKQQYTLFDKFQCSTQQAFNILLHALKGFQILYEKFGFFTVNSKLIFFNRNNEVKVWINQDLKITKNIQFPSNLRNIQLQTKFIREIVHLFDFLRDRNNPMMNYSSHLPHKLLTFRQSYEILMKKSVQFQAKNTYQQKINLNQNKHQIHYQIIHPVQQYHSPRIQRVLSPVFIKKSHQQIQVPIVHKQPQIPYLAIKNPVSCHSSPMNSPRQYKSPINQRQIKPQIHFEYKQPKTNIKFGEKEQIKIQEFKKQQKINKKISFVKKENIKMHNPSRQIKSTMPNSLRNSFVHQKTSIIYPVNTNQNSPKDIEKLSQSKDYSDHNSSALIGRDDNITSFGKEMEKYPKLKVRIQEKTNYVQNPSLVKVFVSNLQSSNNGKSNNIYLDKHQQIPNSKSFHLKSDCLPQFSQNCSSQKKQFHTHKRHRTDFKQKQVSSLSNSKFSMQGHQLTKFNLNTIKSIHLLEEKDVDNDIIIDLKKLINKYLHNS